MKEHVELLRITRNNMLQLVDALSDEQLNKVPEGFSNNIIWNLGHCLVTAQLLIYKLSGAHPRVSEQMINAFRKGTRPEKVYDSEEIAEIKNLLQQSVDWLEEDYANGSFTSFSEYPTSYNVVLHSTEDAIRFNNVHEGLHLGYMMALRKAIKA